MVTAASPHRSPAPRARAPRVADAPRAEPKALPDATEPARPRQGPLPARDPGPVAAPDPKLAKDLAARRALAQAGASSVRSTPLPEGTRALAKEVSARHSSDAAFAERVRTLCHSDAFRGLAEPEQAAALRALDRNPKDAQLGADLEALAGDARFKKLAPEARERWLERSGDPKLSRAERTLGQKALSSDLAKLDPKAQVAAASALTDPKVDAGVAKDVGKLAGDASFRKLSPDVQAKALAVMGRDPGDPEAAAHRAETLRFVTGGPFRHMSPKAQAAWLDGLASPSDEVAFRARARIGEVEGMSGWDKIGDDKRGLVYEKFSRGVSLPHGVEDLVKDGDWDRYAAKVVGPKKVGEVADADFLGGKAKADKYTVEVDGHKVDVYVAKPRDEGAGVHLTPDDVAKSLARMPKALRADVKEVYLEAGRYGGDAEDDTWFQAREKGRMSAFALDQKPSTDSLTTVLVHEAAHNASMRRWGTEGDGKKWAAYRKAAEKDPTVPSWYGGQRTGEDFAEASALYFKVKGTDAEKEWRAKMPARFAILDEFYGK